MTRAARPGRVGLAAVAVTVARHGRRVRFGYQRRAARRRRRRPSDSTSWPTTSTGSTAPVTRSASIPPPTGANLADTLPPLDEFPITAQAPASADEVIEVWSSTEKSGQDSDGWYREVAEDFNDAGITLSDGSVAGVDLRSIASGTGYQFIARGEELPPGLHTVERAVGRDGQ